MPTGHSPQPLDNLQIGVCELIPVSALRKALQMSAAACTKFLATVYVPVMYLPNIGGYVLRQTLEEALVSILDYGEPGFAAPGSFAKNTRKHPGGCSHEVKPPTATSRKYHEPMLKSVRDGSEKSTLRRLKKALTPRGPKTAALAKEVLHVTHTTDDPALQPPEGEEEDTKGTSRSTEGLVKTSSSGNGEL